MVDDNADHAARAIIGGRATGFGTDEIFASLTARGYSSADLRSVKRDLDAMQIGVAIEHIEKAPDPVGKRRAMLRLARALSPHLQDRSAGWFRFLVSLGSHKGKSRFRFAVLSRPHSSNSQPVAALNRTTQIQRNIDDGFSAGAILSRISDADSQGRILTVQDAIEDAINASEIGTEEQAARKAFQRFRHLCERISGGKYSLERYAGSIEVYVGRWTAIPDDRPGSLHLPSTKGGRPRT